MYYWGSYETNLYKMYVDEEGIDAQTQIDALVLDIEMAESEGMPVAPGIYAHLGMMYASVGDVVQARAAFETEKTLFPEATVLIDGMIERSENQGESNEEI